MARRTLPRTGREHGTARREWAIADQLNGGGLGPIKAALYKIGADPVCYADDFCDITVGNDQTDPSVAGYPATTGWDPVTGLGTPNAANLIFDLVLAVHGISAAGDDRATHRLR